MNQPAYPSNLQDIFDKGNYSVLPEVMRQQSTAQQQAEANLASTQQATDFASQKLPYELDQMGALTDQAKANAGHSTTLTKEINDKIAALPPAEQRMAAAKAKLYAEASESQLKQLDAKYNKLGMFATAAEQNGGQVPLALQQDPDFQSFAPFMQNPNWIKSAKSALTAHNALSPAFQQHIATANIAAAAQRYAADQALAGHKYMADKSSEWHRALGGINNLINKGKTSGSYQAQSGAWSTEAMLMEAQLADMPEGPEKEQFKKAIEVRKQLADYLRRADYDKAAAAQLAALRARPDLPSLGLQSITPPTPTVNTPPGGAPTPQPAASAPVKMDKAAILKAYRDAGSTGTDQEILDYHNKTYGGK